MNVIKELRLQIIADWLRKSHHHVVSKTDWWEFVEGVYGEHTEYLVFHEVNGMKVAFHGAKPVAWVHNNYYAVVDEKNAPTLKSVSSTQTRKSLQATTIHNISKNS